MRYSVKQYANTFVSALRGVGDKEEKSLFTNFFNLLVRNGDFGKRREIFKEIEKADLKSYGARKVVLESPFPVSEEVKSEIEKNFGGKVYFEEKINQSLIGGIKILVDDEHLIDGTVKKQLDRLFPNKNNSTINR